MDPAAGAELRIVDFRLRHYIIRPSPSKTSKYQFPYRRNVDYTLFIAVTPIFWAGADGEAGAVFRDTVDIPHSAIRIPQSILAPWTS